MVAKYVVSPRGGRGVHPDITSALLAAARRGRAALIEIAPGRYEESLTVRGEVRLVAAGGPGSVVVGQARGAALDAYGTVGVDGLVLTGREADTVACHAGTLTLDRVEIRAYSGVGVHARPNTSVTLRDSVVLHGRTLFTGARGLVERCRFTDATDNAVAVIEGSDVTVRGSRIEGSRIHGVRVSGARAEVSGCELTGTGLAAVVADAQAELAVSGCAIDAVHAEGICFIEQSRGSVDSTRVTDAQHGIAVTSGSDPVVRGCTFTRCRDTGINVRSAGRGRFEECTVTDAGNAAVLSTEGGSPEIHGCRVSGGNVGVAVMEAGRGRFTRVVIEDLTSVALRVRDGSTAVFEHIRVERCPSQVETLGNGGTTADITDAVFRDFDMCAVEVLGQSRVRLKDVSAERGTVGFGVGEEAQLLVRDCEIKAVSRCGAIAFDKGRLVARNLTVSGSGTIGLSGSDFAYLDVADSEFSDCAAVAVSLRERAGGRLVNCTVAGEPGTGVRHNGLVDLVSLHTSLPVVEEESTEPAGPPPTIVNNFNAPVFNDEVHGVQLAWNNTTAIQQQTGEGGTRS
ncbi:MULTISPECIES: right-handed parallel beta-helix repeat-containing protein [unclassified Streptomyces]|uniref:right-handed parallel beta-helix repeat-containing protein n=1 Tax=unclassified Streptomyces TaxID=2593676 RepID=UPI00081D5267|nr:MULTISPECIES: right-handed parallel beta-helix repeat-containing protein [unclassified Streptomyces]MYR94615.1 right-handed parallel beta-helix repeat-containing protein [Streptomyces sp. SID4937]SCD74467.1 parallel beta-helix repeat (two copies) [Streptomyces sp. ScaeMP-e83]